MYSKIASIRVTANTMLASAVQAESRAGQLFYINIATQSRKLIEMLALVVKT